MIVLDTHVLIWLFTSNPRMSSKARAAISDAAILLISPITLWEVAMLAYRRRINLVEPTWEWLEKVCQQPKIHMQQITPRIADISAALTMHGDPSDRLIVATAVHLNIPLVSADKRIAKCEFVQTIW